MSEYNSLPQPTDSPLEVQSSVAVDVAPSRTLTWLKRGLAIGALASIAYGGVQTFEHSGEVEDAIVQHDAWALPAFAVTEGAAWGGAFVMAGGMGAKKSFRNASNIMKDIPGRMRELEGSKIFQTGMYMNMAGAVGTTSVIGIGAESLPESARPLAYGIAAASLAISAIPIKAAYMIDKHNQQEAQ